VKGNKRERRKGGQNWGEENIPKYDILNLLEAISFELRRNFLFGRGPLGNVAIHKGR
jgi:hypothetical protein